MTGAELRAAILQAAVQGKLVPQDPTDEPASVLLERIREERRALVKAKKTKAPKGGESIITRCSDGTVWEARGKGKPVEIADEVPFDIPDGWEWARMGSIVSKLTDGSHNPPPKRRNGYKVISAANIKNGHIDFNLTQRFCDEAGFVKENPRTNIVRGDIILGIIGGSIGNLAIYDHDEQVIAQRSIAIIRTIELDAFVYMCLQAPYVMELLTHTKAGTAQGGVYLGSLSEILVPVPPLAEQQRIVAKLNELTPLIERYDKLDRERTELNAGIEAAMRASLLHAAVQGRLTEQDPADEPASVLLERIREERRELVKAKKAKAPKGGESVIWRASDGTVWEQRGKEKPADITEEVPFDIPEGWEWARLDDVAMISGGGTPDKSNPKFWNGDILWASVKDIKGDYLTSTIDTITREGLDSKASISECVPGDLIVATRLVPGKSIIPTVNCVINQDLKRIRTMLDVRYLHVWFQSERPRFHELGQGTTVPGIKNEALQSSLVPIPPLAEQRRIVAKLDEVLPLTERLGKLVS